MRACFSIVLFLLTVCFAGHSSEKGDPSDIWYRGFILTKKAEELEKAGEFLNALNSVENAFTHFKSLRLSHPEYHTALVETRLQLLAEKRVALKSKIAPASEVDQTKIRLKEIEETIRDLEKKQTELKERLEQLQQKQGAVPGTLRDQSGTLYAIENPSSPKIPGFWIKREYDGETTYILPLIETNETKAFSKLTPAPARLDLPSVD